MKIIYAVIFLVLLFSGCADFPKKNTNFKSPDALETAAILKFIDVPAPAGFKLMPQNSYSFESSGVRVGVLRYQGKAGADQVVNFYKEQMPMYNWTLLNVIEYGDRLLNFERENETCIVVLSVKENNHLTLSISLGPKSQIPAKKLKTPVK